MKKEKGFSTQGFSSQGKQEIVDLVNKYKKQTDHLLVRFEKVEQTVINIRNRALENVSLPSRFGGSVRVLIKGGWGNVSFTDLTNLEPSIIKAIKFAKLVGKGKSQYAPVKPTVDTVVAKDELKDFLEVSLKEKVSLITKYAKLIYKTDPNLVKTDIIYNDTLINELIINSDGTVINQERAYVYSYLLITARKGNVIQQLPIKLTDRSYCQMLNRDKEIKTGIALVNQIAEASSIKSDDYTVIVDQYLAGTFIHEAFGHLSEGDNVDENEQLIKLMKVGRQLGQKILTVIDDPTIFGQRGGYIYDAEGTLAKKTILIRGGKLAGRLHGRETAARLDEAPNGFARANSAKSIPQVRMGVTYIKAGKSNFEQMIKNVTKGLYCIQWLAGMTDHENFTFTPLYAREIIDGKLGKIVRDVKLAGNLFDTLKQIDMVGNDVIYEGGNCGKGGQITPNSSGGPHIRFKKIKVIGGEE